MIKVEEVDKAQELWGSGIVKIGELKSSFNECRMYALDFIKKMYNFDNGSFQFKPTKAADSQFMIVSFLHLKFFLFLKPFHKIYLRLTVKTL